MYSQNFIEMKQQAIRDCRPARRTQDSELAKNKKKQAIIDARNDRQNKRRAAAKQAEDDHHRKQGAKKITEQNRKVKEERVARKITIQKAMEKVKVERNKIFSDGTPKVNAGHITKLVAKEKVFKSKGGPDITGKILVQIDSRTWVYVNPGQDIEKVKLKYKNRTVDEMDSRIAAMKEKGDIL